jgi:Ca-activated chloride channel family protein
MIRPDFYAVLGVPRVASAEEIRQAYYHLARQHHPDASNEADSAQFKVIAEAYRVLGTPQLRVAYDEALYPTGRERQKERHGGNGAPPVVPSMHVANPALTLEITPGLKEITPLQDMTRFYLLAELGPAGVSAVLEPQPLDLALLVDRSNSMHGEKIFQSLHAIQSMLDHLHMDDLLTLVFFDDFAEVVTDGETPRGRPGIEEALKGITVRGSTEMAKGLELTLDKLAARTPSSGRARAASLVLLTDGQTYGDEPRCFELANKARENGISITTLGLGAEWNRSLLDRLSAISGGSSHYVAQPADLTGYFGEVVHQLRATLALNMRMTFEPARGAHILRATRVAPDIAEAYDVPTDQLAQLPGSNSPAGAPVTVDLGALVGRPDRETTVVLWELLLDPRQMASRVGEYTLGEVSAAYAATQHNNQMEQLRREVTVHAAETPSAGAPIESDVKLALQLATAYRCQVHADSLIHDGNTEEALSQLATASLRLQNAGDADLAIKAQQTAQKLATGTDQGGVDDMLQVRYQTKNLGLFHRLRQSRSS